MIIAFGALALAAGGCGVEEHANDPRPSPPVRISVTLNTSAVTVTPAAVGVGPERSQQIPQNRRHTQPPIRSRAPLVVTFVIANLTSYESHLEIRGPRKATSETIVANGNGTFQAELPSGTYTPERRRHSRRRPAHLIVGPYRASSQNDVLLP